MEPTAVAQAASASLTGLCSGRRRSRAGRRVLSPLRAGGARADVLLLQAGQQAGPAQGLCPSLQVEATVQV